jgi:hypothetical protein
MCTITMVVMPPPVFQGCPQVCSTLTCGCSNLSDLEMQLTPSRLPLPATPIADPAPQKHAFEVVLDLVARTWEEPPTLEIMTPFLGGYL